MQTTVIIPGIHCAGCAALIKDVTADFPAVRGASVDLETKRVTLEHDEAFDIGAWKREIESLGPTYAIHPTP